MKKIKKFLFQNTGIKQTIIKNTFWLAFSTILIKIVRAFIIIYIARILGTENYGIFSYILSLIAIFSIFSDMGLTSILTREITKHSEEKEQYISTALIIKLCFLFTTILLAGTIGPLISKFHNITSLIIIMSLSLSFESLRNFFYAMPRAENKMQIEAVLGIITEIISTIIIVITFLNSPTIESIMLAYMISNGIGLLITFSFLHKKISGIYKFFRKELFVPIIKSSFPFAVMGVFGVLMTNIDSIIIGIYKDANVLGVYAAAQRPISLLYVLPGFLSTSTFPIINQLLKNKEDYKLLLFIKKYSTALIGISLPLVIGGIILASPLINVVYGYEYIGAVSTFQILLFAMLIVFPCTAFSDVIFAKNKQNIFIKSSIIGAIINVGLDFLLIPKYGIVGSAIATLCALFVVNIIFYTEIKKDYKFNILNGTKKIILSSLIMGILVFTMKSLFWPLILIIPIAIIIYFGILFILKEEILQDIKKGFTI